MRIGALLPFSGSGATSGTNIERALLLGAEKLNEAGGIAGRPVAIIARDGHADLTRGIQAATQLLDADGVSLLLGPEDGELARALEPLIAERKAVLIAGGVTAPTFRASSGSTNVFRIVPAPTSSASAVARLMFGGGARTLVVVYVDDAYGRDYARVAGEQFEKLGGKLLASVSHLASEHNFQPVVTELERQQAQAVLLVSYPAPAAALVQDALTAGTSAAWFFAPSLRVGSFVQNTVPGALNGRQGVSLALSADAETFASEYQKRWNDLPLTESYFYFDALALSALALQSALLSGERPSADTISNALRAVTTGSSTAPWYDLSRALREVASGISVFYRGVTGAVHFDSEGQVSQGLIRIWQIDDGRITDVSVVAAQPL